MKSRVICAGLAQRVESPNRLRIIRVVREFGTFLRELTKMDIVFVERRYIFLDEVGECSKRDYIVATLGVRPVIQGLRLFWINLPGPVAEKKPK